MWKARSGLCLRPVAVWLSHCLRVRLSCCAIKRVSTSCHPGLSLVLGPRLGTGSFSNPHTPRHTPLAAVQRPCAGRPAVLFHAFSTKRLFLHPGHVHAPSAGVGGGRGGGGLSRSTLAAHIRPLLSHTVWGSSLCLIPVISIQMGPWWPSPWCSCHRVRSVSGSRGVGSLHLAP